MNVELNDERDCEDDKEVGSGGVVGEWGKDYGLGTGEQGREHTRRSRVAFRDHNHKHSLPPMTNWQLRRITTLNNDYLSLDKRIRKRLCGPHMPMDTKNVNA